MAVSRARMLAANAGALLCRVLSPQASTSPACALLNSGSFSSGDGTAGKVGGVTGQAWAGQSMAYSIGPGNGRAYLLAALVCAKISGNLRPFFLAMEIHKLRQALVLLCSKAPMAPRQPSSNRQRNERSHGADRPYLWAPCVPQRHFRGHAVPL